MRLYTTIAAMTTPKTAPFSASAPEARPDTLAKICPLVSATSAATLPQHPCLDMEPQLWT